MLAPRRNVEAGRVNPAPHSRGTRDGIRMYKAFNRRRGLRATLTLVAAGAATLAAASGSALATTHTSSQATAACVTHASTPFRTGDLSGIIGALPSTAACQAANPDAGQNARFEPPLIWHGGAVMGTAQ